MARPIEYDMQEFLDKATDLFLKKGYGETSMRDILEQTGLNRHSLYLLFKSKADLYRETLKNYREHCLHYGYEILETEPHEVNNIRNFFALLLAGNRPVCCLMVDTIAESDLMSHAPLALAKTHFKRIEKAYELNFAKAIENGSISRHKDPKNLAVMMVNHMQGLPISTKIYGNKKILKTVNQFIDLVIK